MAEILALGASGDFRVPVEVDVKSGKTWSDGLSWSSSTSEYAEEEKFITMNTYLDSEPARIELYVDCRDGAADNFPQVVLCDECATKLGGEVGELTKLEAQKAAVCERRGRRNAAVMLP